MNKAIVNPLLTATKSLTLSLIFLSTLLTSACTSLDQQQLAKVITSNEPEKALKKYVQNKSSQYQQSPDKAIKDLKQLEVTLQKLSKIVESIWGKDNAQIASKKKYVKYTNHYQSKAQVDFELGIIKIETVAEKKPLAKLKQAIVMTLLTSDNPANTDIFSDKSPVLNGKPYLLNQVVDQDKQAIAYQWRANRFADYLIKTQLNKQHRNKQLIHSVTIDMVSKHSQLRKNKYADFVLASANRYQINPTLIYAIIETESSFNPFAVSHANAYGLMQVIPATAGKDVYQRILKKPGMPSKKLLFTAKDNIDIGTAYLHLLEQQYLKRIDNAQSRHFAMISAYNGGAGNVYKTFSNNRDNAPNIINKLPAQQVYNKLTKQHPKAESRRYLHKVTAAEKRYR